MPTIDIAIASGVGLCLILVIVSIAKIGALKDRLRQMEMDMMRAVPGTTPGAAEADPARGDREIKLAKDLAAKQKEVDRLTKKIEQAEQEKGQVVQAAEDKQTAAEKEAGEELKALRDSVKRVQEEKSKLEERLGEQDAKIQRLEAAEAARGDGDEEFAKLSAAMDKALVEKNAEIRALTEVIEAKELSLSEQCSSALTDRDTLRSELAEQEEKIAALIKSEKEFNSLAENMSSLLEEKDDELEAVKESLESLREEKRALELELVEALAEKEKRIRELEAGVGQNQDSTPEPE